MSIKRHWRHGIRAFAWGALALCAYGLYAADLPWRQWGSWLLWLLALGTVALFALSVGKHYRRIRLRERLLARYDDEKIVDDMLNQVIWEGETHEQLRVSLGEPDAVDALQRQTKKKEIWKYGHEFGNRFRLRVVLDDDQVVSWKLRS